MKTNIGRPDHFGGTATEVSAVIRADLASKRASRLRLLLTNTGSAPVFVALAPVATVETGAYLAPGASLTLTADDRYSGPISAICRAGATATYSGIETAQTEGNP
jgi:hypothetical protein